MCGARCCFRTRWSPRRRKLRGSGVQSAPGPRGSLRSVAASQPGAHARLTQVGRQFCLSRTASSPRGAGGSAFACLIVRQRHRLPWPVPFNTPLDAPTERFERSPRQRVPVFRVVPNDSNRLRRLEHEHRRPIGRTPLVHTPRASRGVEIRDGPYPLQRSRYSIGAFWTSVVSRHNSKYLARESIRP